MKLSVAIITLNEASNIARAIKSASFADEIVVLDSFSTDETKKIATDLGATVYEKEFLGYGTQKNMANDLCKGSWVFSMDADEEITSELKDSILKAMEQDEIEAFVVNRRTQFCGKWIYHGGWYPDKLIRLFKKDKAKWTEPKVHEQLLAAKGVKVSFLDGHLNHYSFPSVLSQINTNIKYAPLGAQSLLDAGKRPGLLTVLIRPFGKFIECFIWKKGFLDGVRGLIIAINASYSLFLKYSIAYFKRKYSL